MVHAVYQWMMDKAGHRHALWWLAAISFVESSFFPIPPDIMLIPMVLAARERWVRLALVCTIASVVGGYLGYAIGYSLMDTVGKAILDFFHLMDKFQEARQASDAGFLYVILIKGLIPIIPFKLVTITAGALHYDLFNFTWATIAVRASRFFLVAWLLWKHGAPIRDFIEGRLKLVMMGTAAAIVAGFVVVKVLL